MKKIMLLFFLSSSLFVNASDIDSIAKRTIRLAWEQVGQSTTIADAQSYSASMQSDGSWSDITYTSSTSSGGADWIPSRHLNRLRQMTIAYTAPWSSLKADSNLYNNIINGLNYWKTKNLSSTSWWFNEIAVPKTLGIIVLMMRYEGAQKIDSSLEADLISRMNKGNPSAQSGANRIDVATHFIYRGCLTNDTTLIRNNANLIYGENNLRTGEGLQHDYSYAQHSIQLHIFGYGDVYAYGQVITAYVTAGTIFSMPPDKMNNLSIFLRGTIVNEIRGSTHSYHSFGRQISRPGATGIKSWIDLFNKMAVLDAAHATVYNNGVARFKGAKAPGTNITATHKHYWRTDYSSMQNPAFSFSTRFSSTKTVQAESGNGENSKGGYLSIGSTSIMVNGNEYFDIFPIWDWNKIPGTTAPQKTTVPQNPYITKGTSTFAGGASTGKIGVSAFSMKKQWNVNAQKGWFMFENEIVCLGSGINTNATSPTEIINTTVNQAFLDSNVTVSEGGNITTVNANTQTTLTNPKWILHDSIAYIFPTATSNLKLSTAVQSGSWYEINSLYSSTLISRNVFKLWFDHGAAPSGNASSYAYIIVPGKKTIAEVKAYNAEDIVIIANDTIVQAVKKASTNTIQAIFYAAGSLTSGDITITVDQPCTLILESINTGNVKLTLADPSKTSGRSINATVTTRGAGQTINFEMPAGTAFLGSSITKNVDLSAAVFNADSTAISLLPIADSYVRNGSYANNNYGNDERIVIKNDGSSYKRETYLKFDLSEVGNHKIDSATLKLTIAGGNTNAANTTIAVRKGASDAWTETGITWNNQPALLNNIVTSTAGKRSGTFEFNLTNAVLEELATDKILTIKISSETKNATGDITMYSKEWPAMESRPVLLLQLATATLTPVADSYVRDGSYASNNYGNDNTIVIKNDGSSFKRETYLKFDLSNIGDSKIASGKLKITLAGGNVSAPNTTVAVRKGANDAWTETGITWNNQPGSLTNIVATAAGKTSGTLEFDVTSAILEEIAADKTLTLRVSSETKNASGDMTLFSKEASVLENRPILLLKFSEKPVTTPDNDSAQVSSRKTSSILQTTGTVAYNKLSIYPNPVSGTLYISAPSLITSLRIIDAKGVVKKQIAFEEKANLKTIQIDVSNLNKGIYILVTDTKNGRSTNKFMKQ